MYYWLKSSLPCRAALVENIIDNRQICGFGKVNANKTKKERCDARLKVASERLLEEIYLERNSCNLFSEWCVLIGRESFVKAITCLDDFAKPKFDMQLCNCHNTELCRKGLSEGHFLLVYSKCPFTGSELICCLLRAGKILLTSINVLVAN